ncbi:hypothetical protein R6Q59_017021 [Mikania micrantha]
MYVCKKGYPKHHDDSWLQFVFPFPTRLLSKQKKDEALNMAATKSSEIVKKSFKKEKGKQKEKSNNVFKIIYGGVQRYPQPVQVEYDKHEDFFKQRLGVIIDEEDKECRCIYSFFTSLSGKKWVTKNKWGPYNEIRKKLGTAGI